MKKKLAEDPAIRAFIRRSAPPETFTHLAAELRAEFGLELSPQEASHLWRTLRPPRPGQRAAFALDAPVMAFVGDRADLMTTVRLRAEIIKVFGAHRAPSKSQLHRLVQKIRAEARASFDRPGGFAS